MTKMLAALQRDFRAALVADDTAIQAGVVAAGIAPARRVAIYRNAVRANWRGALAAAYPVVLKLVGEPFFNEAADRYSDAHPSASGDLHDFGPEFAAFLCEYSHAQELPYLADVARLEWAVHRAFHAADAAPLDLTRLATVPPEQHGGLTFTLAPAVHLLNTHWPVLQIWRANLAEADLPADFDIHAGGERLLVWREGFDPVVEAVTEAEFDLLAACANGEPLAMALERPGFTSSPDAGAYLLAALQRFAASGVLVDFVIAQASAD